MQRPELTIPLLFLLFVVLCVNQQTVEAQSFPIQKPVGFVYHAKPSPRPNATLIEAFLDPVCTDSKDAWEPLKQTAQHYKDSVQLVVHLLPTPYYHNSFILSRALHLANDQSSSAVFLLLSEIFKHQQRFFNAYTQLMTKAAVVKEVVQFATKVLGNSSFTALDDGFIRKASDLNSRISFKYSITRGVHTTPTYFINGFPLPNPGTFIAYDGWRSILDPLLNTTK